MKSLALKRQAQLKKIKVDATTAKVAFLRKLREQGFDREEVQKLVQEEFNYLKDDIDSASEG